KNYSPKEIFELIFELHLIVDKMESITSFPRLKLLPNSEDFMPIKSDLDRKLLEDLLDNNSSNISLSYFTEQDSDIIVHSLHSDVEVKYGSKSENAEFNIDSIKSAIRELKCQKI